MAVLKPNGLAGAALVALAMLATSSQAALAKVTTLTCTAETRPQIGESTLTFDESAGTVVFNYGSPVPVPATFSEAQITWEVDCETCTSRDLFTLSRTTGKLVDRVYGKKSGGVATFEYACSVAQKRF
jgi:hypothetical protein